jgi:hypothetical protein
MNAALGPPLVRRSTARETATMRKLRAELFGLGSAVTEEVLAAFLLPAKRARIFGDRVTSQARIPQTCWDAPNTTLAAAMDSETDRLERELPTLRKVRATLFKPVGAENNYQPPWA